MKEDPVGGWARLESLRLRDRCRIAAAVAFLVYLPSVAGPFLYDDMNVVVDNPSIRTLAAPGLILLHDRARPLLNVTWAINYALSGLEPWSYHLGNVLIHAGNAALLAWLFSWIVSRAGTPRPSSTALVGALIFAASPMAAETVAYVASRSTALSTLLGLVSLCLAMRAFEGSPYRLWAAVGALVLALLTKEEAAAVPLLLLLLDFFFLAKQDTRAMRVRVGAYLLLFSVPVLGLCARRYATGTWLPVPEMPRLHYAVAELAAFPAYLLRQLLPLEPALYRGHGTPWPPSAGVYVAVCVTIVVLVGALVLRRRRPLASFAVLWLFLALLPSSSVVPLAETLVDHRAYLGGAGVFLVLGSWIARVRSPKVAYALLALLALRSLQYEWVLGDPVRAWGSVCARVPGSPLALRSLAEAYAAAGDPVRAEEAFEMALALAPSDRQTLTNLATFYAESGRFADARRTLMKALPLASPSEAGRLHDNLGMILLQLGLEDEAIAELETAAASDPGRPQPRISLAQIFIKRGDTARARALIEEAARLPAVTPVEAAWIERLRAQTEPGYRRETSGK